MYKLGQFSVFPIDLRFGILEEVIICSSALQLVYFHWCFLSVVPDPCEFMSLKKDSLWAGFAEVQKKAKLGVLIRSIRLAKNSPCIFYVVTACIYE